MKKVIIPDIGTTYKKRSSMEFDHLPRGRRLDAVSPNDVKKALRLLALWMTYKLKDRTDSGAFSDLVLGEPAVKYFSRRAIMKLWTGDWQWKKDLTLAEQLIRIAKSDMSHHVRDWQKNHEPELSAMSNMTDAQMAKMELVNQEFAEDLDQKVGKTFHVVGRPIKITKTTTNYEIYFDMQR